MWLPDGNASLCRTGPFEHPGLASLIQEAGLVVGTGMFLRVAGPMQTSLQEATDRDVGVQVVDCKLAGSCPCAHSCHGIHLSHCIALLLGSFPGQILLSLHRCPNLLDEDCT